MGREKFPLESGECSQGTFSFQEFLKMPSVDEKLNLRCTPSCDYSANLLSTPNVMFGRRVYGR